MKWFRILGFLLTLAVCQRVQAQTATVTWGTTYQTIDGFGAASIFLHGNSNLASHMGLFFNPSTGVGYSILRVEVPDDGSCTTVNSTCAGDLTTMNAALAINPALRIFATSLSPPASMKTNANTFCTAGPGNGALLPGSYAAFATYLANYVKSVAAQGISLYAVSITNEPNYCASYDAALWTAAQIDTFVRVNLGPTFAANGITTKIMLPESDTSSTLAGLANTTMTDSSAVGYVGLVATHDYSGSGNLGTTAQVVTYTTGGKNFWETEVSDYDTFDATITSGLIYAKEIHDWMTGSNLNAWNFWWLVGLNGNNEGLIDNATSVVAKRLYTIGNFAKFVRPGWVRIDATATPQALVLVSAYKDPSSGNFAIVVINRNGSSVSQDFSLVGYTTSSATPWITSASLNLTQQSIISVSGNSFSYTLPADSVTTFFGVAANADPNPPAGLKATVH